MKKNNRFKLTIERHGLGEYETGIVEYALKSSSPQDALRRVQAVYDNCQKSNKRIPYKSKLFLEALAISADADLYYVE